jgi:hypothetical protein
MEHQRDASLSPVGIENELNTIEDLMRPVLSRKFDYGKPLKAISGVFQHVNEAWYKVRYPMPHHDQYIQGQEAMEWIAHWKDFIVLSALLERFVPAEDYSDMCLRVERLPALIWGKDAMELISPDAISDGISARASTHTSAPTGLDEPTTLPLDGHQAKSVAASVAFVNRPETIKAIKGYDTDKQKHQERRERREREREKLLSLAAESRQGGGRSSRERPFPMAFEGAQRPHQDKHHPTVLEESSSVATSRPSTPETERSLREHDDLNDNGSESSFTRHHAPSTMGTRRGGSLMKTILGYFVSGLTSDRMEANGLISLQRGPNEAEDPRS